MRIAYCSVAKLPSREANSIQTMKMAQALAELGNAVRLYVPDYNGFSDINLHYYYNVKDNFVIKKLKWKRPFLHAIIYAMNACRTAKKEGAELVYTRDISCAFFSCILKMPTIWETHMPIEYSRKIYQLFFDIINKSKYLKNIIVISSTLKNYYLEKGVKKEKIVVAPDGADIPANCPVNNKDFLYDFNVGYIGQLYKGKGMEIISQLVKKCPDIGFHILGGMEKDIAFWKEELSDCSNAKFYGYIAQSDLYEYAYAMDLFIAPYMRSVQGVGNDKRADIANWMSPLKLFEYMSYKKPIICSDLKVLHDVISDGVNGLMCNPDNINEWCDAIYYLKTSPQEAERISNNAYNMLVSKYTWSKRAEKILEKARN